MSKEPATSTGDTVQQGTIGAWCEAYRAAFVAAALARGWSRDDANSWACEIDEDAWLYAKERAPAKCAAADVIECEAEAASV